jgi:hypothetical protein
LIKYLNAYFNLKDKLLYITIIYIMGNEKSKLVENPNWQVEAIDKSRFLNITDDGLREEYFFSPARGDGTYFFMTNCIVRMLPFMSTKLLIKKMYISFDYINNTCEKIEINEASLINLSCKLNRESVLGHEDYNYMLTKCVKRIVLEPLETKNIDVCLHGLCGKIYECHKDVIDVLITFGICKGISFENLKLNVVFVPMMYI